MSVNTAFENSDAPTGLGLVITSSAALFPPFLSAAGTSWAQPAIMMALVGIGAFTVALLYGFLGAWVQGLELSRHFMSRLYKATGGLFIASGIGLATARTN